MEREESVAEKEPDLWVETALRQTEGRDGKKWGADKNVPNVPLYKDDSEEERRMVGKERRDEELGSKAAAAVVVAAAAEERMAQEFDALRFPCKE